MFTFKKLIGYPYRDVTKNCHFVWKMVRERMTVRIKFKRKSSKPSTFSTPSTFSKSCQTSGPSVELKKTKRSSESKKIPSEEKITTD